MKNIIMMLNLLLITQNAALAAQDANIVVNPSTPAPAVNVPSSVIAPPPVNTRPNTPELPSNDPIIGGGGSGRIVPKVSPKPAPKEPGIIEIIDGPNFN